jgi:heat shock protein HtpX
MHARQQWHRDSQLTIRMFIVMFLLGALYLAFIGALFYVGFNILFIAVIAGGLALVQYFFSDKLVLASMGAKEVSASEAPELHAMIERLAQAMDLPKPKIAYMQSDVPNAFATGRNPENAVVTVTSGIMHQLSPEELQAVLGHELTHVKNRDVTVITIASFFATIAGFITQWGMFLGLGRSRDDRGGAGAFMIAYLASVLVWIISFFLIRALSRYRELAADRGAAVVTGDPAALKSALMRISGRMNQIPEQDLRRVEGANAFFIIPAVKGFSVTELLSTHPSLERRIEQLDQMQRQMEGIS